MCFAWCWNSHLFFGLFLSIPKASILSLGVFSFSATVVPSTNDCNEDTEDGVGLSKEADVEVLFSGFISGRLAVIIFADGEVWSRS